METFKQHNKIIDEATVQNLYDLSILEEIEDNEYTIEVLSLFMRDMPAELKELTDALYQCNTEIIAKKAHKLKGSAGIIQAEELCNLLNEIEVIAKTGVVNDSLKTLVENTQLLYNVTEQALNKYIQELK